MDVKIYLNAPERARAFTGWFLDPEDPTRHLLRCTFGVMHHAEDCMDADGNPLPFCPCEAPDRSKLTVLAVGGSWYGSPAIGGVCPMRYDTVKFFLCGEGDIIALAREWCQLPIHEYWNGQYGNQAYYADKSVSSRASVAWLNGEEIPNPLTAADIYRR